MTQFQSAIRNLRQETLNGPVFGHEVAFGRLTEEQTNIVDRQIATIATTLAEALRECLTTALPDRTTDTIEAYIKAIVPKTAAFVPTLTVGELHSTQGTQALTSASLAIAAMYATDQLIDTGDQPMLLAVEQAFGAGASVPSEHQATVQHRRTILDFMKHAIYNISVEDGPAIFECFDQKVLVTEAWLQRMSNSFRLLGPSEQSKFLETHSRALAKAMTRNAGVQSVSGSLHASYRQSQPDLPPLAEVHAHPAIRTMLRVCNTVARVADEYSDWWMDAGNDPRYGEFSINPFNHYNLSLIDQLCENANISDPQLMDRIQNAFRSFHRSDKSRQIYGTFIIDTFFAQMRAIIPETLQRTPESYRTYITLVMRVGEISHVNMRGDIALSA